MKLTRRQVLAGAAAGAVGATGIYELIDRLAADRRRGRRPVVGSPEQHLLDGIRVVDSRTTSRCSCRRSTTRSSRRVSSPSRAGAARCAAGARARARRARRRLRADTGRPRRDRGVGAAVLPPARSRTRCGGYLPHDRRAGRPVVFDADRFPSDPPTTRSSSRTTSRSSSAPTCARTSTTRRSGCATRSCSRSRRSAAASRAAASTAASRCRSRWRSRRRCPGSALIPETSELFLGFTSTQRAGMGPGKIANFETLGYVDFRGSDYFRHGTHMHLSHIHEDLEAWYLNFDFDERVATAFRPNLDVKEGTQTVPQGPKDVSSTADVHSGLPSVGPDRAQRGDPDDLSAHPAMSRPTARSTRKARRSRCAPTSTRSTTRSAGR